MDIGIERGSYRKVHKPWSRFIKILFWSGLILVLFFLFISWHVQSKFKDEIITSEKIEGPNIALVFGAGLNKVGGPSHVLEDRVLTAIKLYQDGKVGKIIMSGANPTVDYNEVQAMKDFAIGEGLPEDVIILDYAGRRTYDSCYRVKEIFSLNKIVLITQAYHLPRALYLCEELGVSALGVPAIDRGYFYKWKFSLREWPASFKAWLDINILKPKPILGEKIDL
ncbi:MAG: hypothetical protein UT32_C0017G0009 [Parcubacteria group bacterium GW2011_GWC2_39_14]|nr:MAG: hypothetical protein UT32_C0017G0009 [Parcubacteria group bacterium GW2011_GWC2_39_14]KKR54336.1 MAG: hypothetical protein UT91_C0018G0010 [Parcubacteria group bacterium GW2011_GWA2_40_23]